MVSCMVSKAPYGRADTMGKLYATTVTSARQREREYKLTDGAGLYLLVKPNGRKLWRLNYAYLGKQRTLLGILFAVSASVRAASIGASGCW